MEASPHSTVAFSHTPSSTPLRQKVLAQAGGPARAAAEHKPYSNPALGSNNNAGRHAYRICYTLPFPLVYGYISGIASSVDNKEARYSLYCARRKGNKLLSGRSLSSLA